MNSFQSFAQLDVTAGAALAIAAGALAIGGLIVWWLTWLVMGRRTRERDAELRAELDRLNEQTRDLRDATNNLNKDLGARLNSPNELGAWGENVLKNVVAQAGLRFSEQDSTVTGRPDMRICIEIPGPAKLFAVDAKNPLGRLRDAGGDVKKIGYAFKGPIDDLGVRQYHTEPGSAPFTVMFVPNELCLSAAVLGQIGDKGVLDYARERAILIASPATLTALLAAYTDGFQTWDSRALFISQFDGRLAEITDRLRDLREWVANQKARIDERMRSNGRPTAAPADPSGNGAIGTLSSPPADEPILEPPAAVLPRELTFRDPDEAV